MTPINLKDAARYYKSEPHQNEAYDFLQSKVPKAILETFATMYRGVNVPSSGVSIIKEFEGCSLDAYPDPLTGSLPITIGWGSTRDSSGNFFKLGQRVTQQEADDLLLSSLKSEYLPPLTKIPYWGEMASKMQGALLSFAYNLGANFYGSDGFNTISRCLREKKWEEVPQALMLYVNPGSSVTEGLKRRRKTEGQLWNEGMKEVGQR